MSVASDWQAIADSIRAELKGETANRAALVAAGKPPPTSYSSGGRNMSWNEYMTTMMQVAQDAQDRATASGDGDGMIEERIRVYP